MSAEMNVEEKNRLVEHIMEKLKNKKPEKETITFNDYDIIEIDGIEIRGIEMRFGKDYWALKINSSIYQDEEWIVLYQDFNTFMCATLRQNICHALDKCADIISKLQFNKREGFFLIKEVEPSLLSTFPSLKNNPKIKSRYQECCVCYDETKTRTPCGHVLCIPCWQKLPKKIHEDDEDEEDEDCQRMCQKCPICRKSLEENETD